MHFKFRSFFGFSSKSKHYLSLCIALNFHIRTVYTLLGLGLGLGFELGFDLLYVRTVDICTYPYYF